MKLAFIDSWLQSSAEGSGTAVAIGGLQSALAAMGHHVERIAPPAGDELEDDLIRRRLRFNRDLPRRLASRDFDLLVGFDIDGCRLSRSTARPPFVASIKGVLAEESLRETEPWRTSLARLARLERANCRQSDLVITTSDYCRRAIVHHYGIDPAKVRIVPEGIDLSRWTLPHEPPPRREGNTILCVARHYRRKRIDDLLHAMALLRGKMPAARAVIVGDGPEHQRWRRLRDELQLGGCVQMTGAIPDDADVMRRYREADVFCLPTIQEGFGIVFLEAMAAGLPVVSTNATAIGEVVPHGKAGLLVEPMDVPALADALLTLLKDADRRAGMVAFGSEYVRRFDWSRVAEMFLEAVGP